MNITGLAKNSYRVRRVRRHLILAASAGTIIWLAYVATPPPDLRHRLSLSTAYAGLVFFSLSLSLGPWNVLRHRSNPVSFDLRRDVGIWTGLLAILHTLVGLTVHLRGRMWMYFLKRLHPPVLQNTPFGFANFVGLAATLLLLMLLAISNDISLRSLGIIRWKVLQRWSYAAFGLTIAHGIVYQFIEKRRLPWVFCFAVLTVIVVASQLGGFLTVRRTRGCSHSLT